MSGAATASFGYDGDGNRVIGTEGGATTVYIGNYFEWKGSTSTMVKYYYAGGTRVAMRTGTANPQWLLGDHLSSTTVVANYDGTLYAGQGYKAWGEQRYWTGITPLPTTFRYTGQRESASFGLYYYGARWYDTALGRFTQPDTIVPMASQGVQAWDRYAYTNNNPVRYNDPSGHCIGPLLAACIAVGVFIMENAGIISAVALAGAVTAFTTSDTPQPELVNNPEASQAVFEGSLAQSTFWLTGGQAALQFGKASVLSQTTGRGPTTTAPGVEDLVNLGTHNPSASEVSIGGYPEYINNAGNSTYFDLGSIYGEYPIESEMANGKFMDEQMGAMKGFNITLLDKPGPGPGLQLEIDKLDANPAYTGSFESGYYHPLDWWTDIFYPGGYGE